MRISGCDNCVTLFFRFVEQRNGEAENVSGGNLIGLVIIFVEI